MARKNWVVIGISGVTCGGKTTLTKALRQKHLSSVIFCQDDYFFPKDSDKHTLIPELNHSNWDTLSAFDMDKMRSAVEKVLNSNCEGESPLLLLEGLLILNDEKLSQLCDKKYYMTLPYETCLARRLTRTYDPPDVPGYFDVCVWPEYLKNKEQALKMNPDVQVIDGVNSTDAVLEMVLPEVDRLIAEFKQNKMISYSESKECYYDSMV